MRYRPLGETGLSVSEISFGAGPVSGLMTNGSFQDRLAVFSRALELGINWFDTAAGYGAGKSETHLGEALSLLAPPRPIHIATKVRLMLQHEADLRPLVVASFRESLVRLRVPHVTLLQLHNSITPCRNDEPTSITPEDVLGPHGVLAAFEDLRAEGLIDHFGLTGIGHPDSLRQVMRSHRFATIQAPFHLLNPTALVETPNCFREPDYSGFLRDAQELGLGLLAIRVYAAGALLGAQPSAHTLKTPFFPLSLYERDLSRATRLSVALGSETKLREQALRYVLSQTAFSSAILGLGAPEHIDEALRISDLGPLSQEESERLAELIREII
ncbi:MAG: aldo/keto reductase [Planctomycetaceae bacterium]|nr:aldo/keto reductase [Planctomycetaceae bacterium]